MTTMSKHMNKACDITMGYSVPLGLIERIADALAAAATEHAAELARIQQLEQDAATTEVAQGHLFALLADRARAYTELGARNVELVALVSELQDALDGMRGIAKDRQEKVAELTAQLAGAQVTPEWWSMCADEIADLRAQLAERGEWEVVPDGRYGVVGGNASVIVHANRLEIENLTPEPVKAVAMFGGNFDFRLMRRKQSEDANG